MSDEWICMYKQVGEAYRTAVDVSMFTYDALIVRVIAFFVAAALVLYNHAKIVQLAGKRTPWILALVVLSVGGSLCLLTAVQARDNQTVIRKILATGIELEYEHARNLVSKPEDKLEGENKYHAGYYYRRTIPEKEQDQFYEDYGRGKKISNKDVRKLGLTPIVERLCYIWGGLLWVAAGLVGFAWRYAPKQPEVNGAERRRDPAASPPPPGEGRRVRTAQSRFGFGAAPATRGNARSGKTMIPHR